MPLDFTPTSIIKSPQNAPFTALVLAPPLYAWADRRLDRTHRATAGEHRD